MDSAHHSDRREKNSSGFEAFASGLGSSLTAPAIGLSQIAGNEVGMASQSNGGVSRTLGEAAGHAALFLGVTALCNKVPFAGRWSPVIAGAALGFLEPSATNSAELDRRALRAGSNAGTMAILSFAPAFGRIGQLGGTAVAASFDTEARSLINHGKFASASELLTANASWYAVAGLGKALPMVAGKAKRTEVHDPMDFDAGLARVRKNVGNDVSADRTVVGLPTVVMRGAPIPEAQLRFVARDSAAAQVFEQSKPAIVRIRTEQGPAGSGFIFSQEGLVGTNAHVALDIHAGMKQRPLFVDLPDGRQFSAKFLAADEAADVAILKLQHNGAKLPTLKLAENSQLNEGAAMFVHGHPQGSKNAFFSIGELNSRSGMEPTVRLKTTANGFMGFSGSPMLDSQSRVIGTLDGSHNTSWHAVGSGIEHLSALLAQVRAQRGIT